MKRVRCPKCDHYITFDETQYEDGQSLVFECPECRKQFGIRIGVSKLRATRKEETVDENENDDAYGSIVVVENVFHYKQVLPLKLDSRPQCGHQALHHQCEAGQERSSGVHLARRAEQYRHFLYE